MAEMYFDYALQVWIVGGVVKPCEHPEWMRKQTGNCCNAWRLQGLTPKEAAWRIANTATN